MRSDDTDQSFVHDARYGTRAPEHFRRCGYCGSIHPQDLLMMQANGELVDVDRSVDWKYGWPHKIYVEVKDKLGQLDWLGGSSHDMSDEEMARYSRDAGGWKRVKDLTEEERAAVVRSVGDISRYAVVGVGVRERHHGKFYSVHTLEPWLLDGQRDKLFELVGYTFEWADSNHVGISYAAYRYDPA